MKNTQSADLLMFTKHNRQNEIILMKQLVLGFLLFLNYSISSQSIIPIFNGSFEKDTHKASQVPFGWYPYGDPKTSSPDIHSRYYTYFGVTQTPVHGDRFVSMVTRNDWSTEGICQFLEAPMLTNGKYRLKMDLAMAEAFQSKLKNDTLAQFNAPARIEIWGFNRGQEKDNLLASTANIDHSDWKTYSILLNIPMQINDLCILASFPEGISSPTNGNLLLDNIQNLEEIYAHPALPTDPKLLQEKSLEDLATIIEKLEPDLISLSETSAQLKIFLRVSNLENALKNQSVQNYIYNEDREEIIQHIKILNAIGADHLAEIIRRAFRSYVHPQDVTQSDVDFFNSVDAIYQKASSERSLLKSKLQFLENHKTGFLKEIESQLY